MFRVLITGDNEISSHYYKTGLRRNGFNVNSMMLGELGLSVYLDFAPNLLVIDVASPNSSGISLIKAIRRQKWSMDTRIIVFSESREALARTKEAGANRVVAKDGLSRNQVVSYISEMINNMPKTRLLDEDDERTLPRRKEDKGTVLVIDDDPDILSLVKKIVEERGYSVRTADNVDEAFLTLSSDDFDFKLCIVNLSIPGISDVELISHLRNNESFREIPILSISGKTSAFIKTSPQRTDLDGLTSNPINREKLDTAIGSIYSPWP